MALNNGLELWRSLVASGLELERKNRLAGYDAALVNELHERLYPDSVRSFEQDMRQAPPSTEAFLDAFFTALKPFSQMLREVLTMFEDAGARRSDENLRIAFNFDEATEELALTVKQFREVEVFFRQITREVIERRWNSNSLFALSGDVGGVITKISGQQPWEFRSSSVVEHRTSREWIEQNGKPNWLQFPGFPTTGNVELDDKLHMAQQLIENMMAEVLKLGRTYREFEARLGQLPTREEGGSEINFSAEGVGNELPRREFVRAAHDFWPNSFAENIFLLIQMLPTAGVEKDQVAADLAAAIQTGFDRPPQTRRNRITLEQEFLELINLPTWKKRHELYAVWVCSRIAKALNDLKWVWHPDGDTLRFSFAGVELATLDSGDARFVLWTEKRTPLPEGGLLGRKHIQPDYRIMTAPTHRTDATSLVVECKQYRRWSKKNFGAALDDYAKGCPNAPVILVNYGPTDPSILSLVDSSRRDRTHLVGNFQPFEDGAFAQFRDLVRTAYAKVLTPATGGEINLLWGSQFRDLDLHLFVKIRDPLQSEILHLGFGGDDGCLTDEPYAIWSGDVQKSPPGTEQITIARWLDADYDLLVHDYSRTAGYPSDDLTLKIVIDGSQYDFDPPAPFGPWWHVCRIHGPDARIEEINQVLAECPY